MLSHGTFLKFWILAFNARIKEEIESKVVLAIFAENEQEALDKAKKLITRNHYEVYEVVELIDDVGNK